MAWFVARILYKAYDTHKCIRLAEESFKLFRAVSLQEAAALVPSLFPAENLDDGFNVSGDPCKWVLSSVLDVYELVEAPTHRAEVYSLILSPSEAEMLEAMIEETQYEDGDDA